MNAGSMGCDMGAAPAELAASQPVVERRAPASGTAPLASRPTDGTTLSAHQTHSTKPATSVAAAGSCS